MLLPGEPAAAAPVALMEIKLATCQERPSNQISLKVWRPDQNKVPHKLTTDIDIKKKC